jgi:peptidoglycan LD-endopeptidase CwlK
MVEACLRLVQQGNAKQWQDETGRVLKVKVIDTIRTPEDQAANYAKGRTRPGVPCHHALPPFERPVGTCRKHPMGATVTDARQGESPHNYGLAFDVCFTTDGKDALFGGPFASLAVIGRNLGLEWGGDFHTRKDPAHFQLARWRHYKEKWNG